MESSNQHIRDVTEWTQAHDLGLQDDDILYLLYDAIDNSIGATIITNLHGSIIYVNKSALKIFGIQRKELLQKQISSIFITPSSSDMDTLVTEISKNSQCLMRRENRSHFYALTITSSVQNLQGKLSGQIFSFIDMTRQNELEESQKLLIRELEETQKRLISVNERLEKISLEDKLTGLANRRSFDISFEIEWRRTKRDNTPISLLMIDVDHFKKFNDRYGHQMGDQCLRTIADAMRESQIAKRAGDLIARYGGEEFVVVLTHTNNENAFLLAERIVQQVRNKSIIHVDNDPGIVTISAGVATVEEYNNHTKEALIKAADDALYLAKQSGRSCVR